MYLNLHSTMYLLKLSDDKPIAKILIEFTFHYVSIKTCGPAFIIWKMLIFTFHYVSIKTNAAGVAYLVFAQIYIPLCIY